MSSSRIGVRRNSGALRTTALAVMGPTHQRMDAGTVRRVSQSNRISDDGLIDDEENESQSGMALADRLLARAESLKSHAAAPSNHQPAAADAVSGDARKEGKLQPLFAEKLADAARLLDRMGDIVYLGGPAVEAHFEKGVRRDGMLEPDESRLRRGDGRNAAPPTLWELLETLSRDTAALEAGLAGGHQATGKALEAALTLSRTIEEVSEVLWARGGSKVEELFEADGSEAKPHERQAVSRAHRADVKPVMKQEQARHDTVSSPRRENMSEGLRNPCQPRHNAAQQRAGARESSEQQHAKKKPDKTV